MEEKIFYRKEKTRLVVAAAVCILILLAAAGYTYSFFSVTVSNSSVITGTVAVPNVNLTVSKIAPTSNNKGLIPQLDSAITSAVIGRNGSCVDDNNNVVCHVYKITVKNTSGITIFLNGTVELNKGNMSNLKWARISNTTTPSLVGNVNIPETTTLTTNEEYSGNAQKDYYIVVWISETGGSQTDSGSYSGVVRFTTANEGISSGSSLATLTSLGLEVNDGTPDFTKTSCSSGCGEATVGIYETEDDLGTSYYFRGDVTNNYVKFGKYIEDAWQTYNSSTGATTYGTSCTSGTNITCTQIASAGDDMYWRIVRINGDGTVRMIYAGTDAHPNGEERESIGGSAYNIGYDDNAYVGYMYGASGQSTYDTTHANTNNSIIKSVVDAWYLKYLNTNYSFNIADAIYCNDRKVVTDNSKYQVWWGDETKTFGNGIGKSDTMYGTWARMEIDINTWEWEVNPTLKCEQANDRFTKNGSTIVTTDGLVTNEDLTYPIGLITSDEVLFAGGMFQAFNELYYLNSGNDYWTMGSSIFIDSRARAFYVSESGYFKDCDLDDCWYFDGVRPVISLEADALTYSATSNGSAQYPFTVG